MAGCVAAAAVVFAPDIDSVALAGIRDSKRLSARQRERLLPRIHELALAVAIGTATPAEIDRLNIRRATALAMERALRQLRPVDHVLLDGLPVPELMDPQTAVVRGDQRCLSVAAASIVAKVNRDGWMRRLADRHPGYGWATNVGYGTPEHWQGIRQQGLTRHHRRSFIPLARLGPN